MPGRSCAATRASAEIVYEHDARRARRLAVPLSRAAAVSASTRTSFYDPHRARESRGPGSAGRHRPASVLRPRARLPRSPAAPRSCGAPMPRSCRSNASPCRRNGISRSGRRPDSVTLDNCFDGWDGRATIAWPTPRAAARPRSVRAVSPSRDLHAGRPALLLRRAGEPRQRPGGLGTARRRGHAGGRSRLPTFQPVREEPCLSSRSIPASRAAACSSRAAARASAPRSSSIFAAQGAKVGLRRHQRAGFEGGRGQDRRAVPEMRHHAT